METISKSDIPFEPSKRLAITFTHGYDIYITKDLARALDLPRNNILFHRDSGKLIISATDKKIGFSAIQQHGMMKLSRARSIARFLESKRWITKGTRFTMHDMPAEKYFIELEREPTRARGKGPAPGYKKKNTTVN